MSTTLRICAPLLETLKRYHLDKEQPVERLSYVFGRRVQAGDRVILLIPNQVPVLFAPDCFVHQSGGHVSLDAAVLNAMLVEFAASDWDVIINVHDHWFCRGGTRFSGVDDADDLAFGCYLHQRFEPMLAAHPEIGVARAVTLAALVLDQTSLDARIVGTESEAPFLPIDTVQVIGEHFRRIVPNGSRTDAAAPAAADEVHARHADFIARETLQALAYMRIALVGCGGLGSIIGEGLVRLGARRLVLVDGDRLEMTNLNRWQGGRLQDLGRHKAELLAERIAGYAEDTDVECVAGSLHSEQARQALRRCDLLIGGLDNDVARVTLNRFAAQYLVPYFDAGVRVQAGTRVDFQSRYFSVLPGTTGCLECSRSNLIDREAVSLALHDPLTRAARAAAGYVTGAPELSAPSVYALNLRISSLLLTELLNYFAGYRRTATTYYDSWRNDLARRFDGDSFDDRPSEDCPVCSYYHGRGDTEPLPTPGGDVERLDRLLAEADAFAGAIRRKRHRRRAHDCAFAVTPSRHL
ncbi:MAG: HesA/MoeB/ThiF family protein [Gammaproteobacteria bacterium]